MALVAVLVLAGAVSCSRNPSAPSDTGSSTGNLSTLVDVPLSVDVTDGLTGTWNWAGQSVTTPAGAGFGSVKFAWYHYNPRGETTAFGRIYVLDREFLGVPGDLNTSMPGFLARSEPEASGQGNAQGSEYSLPSSLVLAGRTRYWFYTDKQGAFATSFDKDVYAGGNLYITGYFANPFRRSMASGRMVNGVFVPAPPGVTTDANFRLRGVAR